MVLEKGSTGAVQCLGRHSKVVIIIISTSWHRQKCFLFHLRRTPSHLFLPTCPQTSPIGVYFQTCFAVSNSTFCLCIPSIVNLQYFSLSHIVPLQYFRSKTCSSLIPSLLKWSSVDDVLTPLKKAIFELVFYFLVFYCHQSFTAVEHLKL